MNSLLATLNARGSLLGKGAMRKPRKSSRAFRSGTLSGAGEGGGREGRLGSVSLSAFDANGHGPGIEVRFRFCAVLFRFCLLCSFTCVIRVLELPV